MKEPYLVLRTDGKPHDPTDALYVFNAGLNANPFDLAAIKGYAEKLQEEEQYSTIAAFLFANMGTAWHDPFQTGNGLVLLTVEDDETLYSRIVPDSNDELMLQTAVALSEKLGIDHTDLEWNWTTQFLHELFQ